MPRLHRHVLLLLVLVLAACDSSEDETVLPAGPAPVCGEILVDRDIAPIRLLAGASERYRVSTHFSHSKDYVLYYTVSNPNEAITATIEEFIDRVELVLVSDGTVGAYPVSVSVDDLCDDSTNRSASLMVDVVD